MFDWGKLSFKAYHEAGHVVVAVLQGLKLAEGGMRIDAGKEGVSRLCIRVPGDLGLTEVDQEQREKSIIVLSAGRIAQLRFDAGNDDPIWWKDDFEWISKLLAEMRIQEIQTVKGSLHKKSEEFINKNWQLIENLAETLLRAPSSSMTLKDYATGCYRCQMNPQKYLTSEEISRFFLAEGVSCDVSADCSSKTQCQKGRTVECLRSL